MRLQAYLIQEKYEVVDDYLLLSKGDFKPENITLVHTQQNKVERTGKTWVGNVYKKKWVGYFIEPNKKAENTIHGKKFNIEIIFNTKKDMQKFLELVK
jgi:hypothetical protein